MNGCVVCLHETLPIAGIVECADSYKHVSGSYSHISRSRSSGLSNVVFQSIYALVRKGGLKVGKNWKVHWYV